MVTNMLPEAPVMDLGCQLLASVVFMQAFNLANMKALRLAIMKVVMFCS